VQLPQPGQPARCGLYAENIGSMPWVKLFPVYAPGNEGLLKSLIPPARASGVGRNDGTIGMITGVGS